MDNIYTFSSSKVQGVFVACLHSNRERERQREVEQERMNENEGEWEGGGRERGGASEPEQMWFLSVQNFEPSLVPTFTMDIVIPSLHKELSEISHLPGLIHSEFPYNQQQILACTRIKLKTYQRQPILCERHRQATQIPTSLDYLTRNAALRHLT